MSLETNPLPEASHSHLKLLDSKPRELKLSPYKKVAILVLLSMSLFVDAFNNTILTTPLPVISSQLHISNEDTAWLFGTYQLAFAASLLMCGRITDLYNPKWVFMVGTTSMTILAVAAGFIRKEVPLIVVRGVMGAGAALTVPSSQHLIVHIFPDPASQAKALAVYASTAGVGLVCGLYIGAAFTEFVSWPWIFYFTAMLTGTISIFVLLLVPYLPRNGNEKTRDERILRFKRLDLIGVTLFTASLILFMFAVTSGSSRGWSSARAIAPLVISVLLMPAFFLWEARIPEDRAAVPLKIWKYDNMVILIAVASIPFMWWSSIYPLFALFWELVDGWSPMKVALHFLPVVLGTLPAGPVVAGLLPKVQAKWVLLCGLIFTVVSNVLLPLADAPDKYWRFGLPGFLLGTLGAITIITAANITLLAITPPHMSGVVSALFMAAANTGGAAGVAIVTSIQTSVQVHHGGPSGFAGRAAGLRFLMAICAVFAVLVVVFMKNVTPVIPVPEFEVKESKTRSSEDLEPSVGGAPDPIIPAGDESMLTLPTGGGSRELLNSTVSLTSQSFPNEK